MTTRPAAIARALTATLAMTALVLATAACTTSEPPVAPASKTGLPPVTAPPTQALAPYYAQKLEWKKCGNLECAGLRVPLDHAAPDPSKDLTIKVARVKARDQSKRLGSLLVNPGGPGASGIDYVRGGAETIGGPEVRRYYDLVGFDPRGVASSDPIDCLDDRALDRFLSTDPTPDDPSEEQALLTQAKAMAAGCEADNPDLVKHLSTTDAARDMDILRAALGDSQLNYLGKSYGTFLGSTYADLFPQRVGRVVLDGVVPPDLTSAELGEGQARGFQIATQAYLEDCVTEATCPLGSTPDEARKRLDEFFRQVDRNPLPTGDPSAPRLTEGWARLGVAIALYDQAAWGFLTDALKEAQSGNGQALMALADSYAHRRPGGGYDGNLLESIFAVNCLDRPDSPDLSAYERYAKDFSTKAPTWGANLAWSALPCGVWPVKSAVGPHTVKAAGSDPIVVVGTTRDPATIYEWSVRLRDQLDNAVLVSFDGDGHTAYGRSNTCVNSAIDAYYVQGRVPKDGLKC
ncbi:alpha/beta hydrolase [Terrabacter sp. MAHUQ-38]|uniref:alpha/beta hydrolase n=1 Tax=unclassified Terrabacter TaxID=2630222 RepID=UPI00165E522E|nr:alpha/beta hydrolase [Terrabacter sp. MAHUQ-38]MBC9822396.1 alpha/beta fold hydrolase [Terrabacter sp. MAHUQ-38]